jgi:hypothetical protein
MGGCGFRGHLGENVAWLKLSASLGRRDDRRGGESETEEEEEARGDLRPALRV